MSTATKESGNGQAKVEFGYDDLVENGVSKAEVLELMSDGSITMQVASQYLDYLLAKAKQSGGGGTPRMKVSEKGGVTFRGVVGTNAKFGLTLYPVTLKWLFAQREQIEAFMQKNKGQLSWGKPGK